MTILRDITNDKHRKVESLPLIDRLLHGKLTDQQYLRYLRELYAIYSKLEDLGDQAGILGHLPGIHRSLKIADDIFELGGKLDCEITTSTKIYLDYLVQLTSNSSTSHLLLAHIYVRHMGDLYGGKLIARVIPGKGTCYMFDDRPGLIKQFNQMLTIELGDEANRAFDFFIDIFSELGDTMNLLEASG